MLECGKLPLSLVETCHIRYVAEYEGVYESGEALLFHACLLGGNALEQSGHVCRLSRDVGDVSVPAKRLDSHPQDSDLADHWYCVAVFGTDLDLFVLPLLLDFVRFDRLVDQEL